MTPSSLPLVGGGWSLLEGHGVNHNFYYMSSTNDKRSGERSGDSIEDIILNGITFRGAPKGPSRNDQNKVKTKAKKKGYITGSHGSGSAKKKADIRKARANRHK